MFIFSSLIRSCKRLPSYGGISHHGKTSYNIVLSNRTLAFFSQKCEPGQFTEASLRPPNKPQISAITSSLPNWGMNDIDTTRFSIFQQKCNKLEADIDPETSEIRIISDHMQKHSKPLSDESFGYYLAGLIEANGTINNDRIEITLGKNDASLAYYIKKRVGFGRVRKFESECLVKYILEHTQGLKVIIDLINGKFLSNNKINLLLENGYDQKYGITISPPADFNIAKNHFLAGFCETDDCFSIVTSDSDYKVKLCFHIGKRVQQKDPIILKKVQLKFGGCLHLDEVTEVYHYEASSFQNNFNVIDYFDHFHLNSSKHVDYFKWRKAYRIIQRGEHLNENGIAKILKLKGSISK